MSFKPEDFVSRRRYDRERKAKTEAETLLEEKSRELFLVNEKLSEHSQNLEKAVFERTSDLRQALELAEIASSDRSRFIATMSHEIRTPLGGLLGMIDLLELDESDNSKLELLKNAKISGNALSRIVTDVLDFSKMEAGVFAFEEENVDIRALVGSVVTLARTNLKGENRSIESQIDASVPKLFLGDATRIRQVVSNLVTNARRYSDKGPIIVRANSFESKSVMKLRVEVEDFGIGIASEQIKNLFKDFSQIKNSLTASAQGTGLGLAISKRIIEGAGGEIGVKSVLGKGSIFWFELPIKAQEYSENDGNQIDRNHVSSNDIDLCGMRILLAEDNLINQRLLMTYLKRMGIEPDLAENGRLALEKFSPGKYDLVLLDAAMPEMDGLEVAKHINATTSQNSIPPIVMLTAHVMDAIQDEAKSVGIKRVLSKPIPFKELQEELKNVIASSKLDYGDEKNSKAADMEEQNLSSGYLDLMSKPTALELKEIFSPNDLSELVFQYLEDGLELLSKIVIAFKNSDHSAVSNLAHTLKGSSLLLGFEKIAELVKTIELQSETVNSDDFDTIHFQLMELFEEIKSKL